MTTLPVSAPTVTPENEKYWTASAEGKLLLQRCDNCAVVIWYPRGLCPDCKSTDISWFEASGQGEIYTWTVSRRGDGPWKAVAPYVIAYVQLDEGPRVMTNIVEADVDSLAIGQRVTAVWDDTGEGNAILRFRPL